MDEASIFNVDSAFLSADIVTDLLLDVRNDARASNRSDLLGSVDRLLGIAGGREILTLEEAAEIVTALERADAATRERTKLRWGRGSGRSRP